MPTKEWTLTGTESFTGLTAGALAQKAGFGEAFVHEVKDKIADPQWYIVAVGGMLSQRGGYFDEFLSERYNKQRTVVLTWEFLNEKDLLPQVVDGKIVMAPGDDVRAQRQEAGE